MYYKTGCWLISLIVHMSPLWLGLHFLKFWYHQPPPPPPNIKNMIFIMWFILSLYIIKQVWNKMQCQDWQIMRWDVSAPILWCEIYFKMCVGPWSNIKCLWVMLTHIMGSNLATSELDQIGVGSNIAQIHSSSLQEVGSLLAQFTW